MPEILPISPADLLIDEENPRNPQPNAGQHHAALTLASEVKRKLKVLAEDIVEYGMDPSDLPIVMRFHGDSRRYVVLEGNRRLVALRALENPDMFSGTVTSGVLTSLRKLSKPYQRNPVESINCVVMDRAEAEHWITLRHTGENDGAGRVPWNSQQASRFKSRAKGTKTELYQQALNFLEQENALPPDARDAVPATTFRRLIETPAVREKLGIDREKGDLKLLADAKHVVKALRYVVDDLVSKRTKVGDVYRIEQRIAYADRLPVRIVVKPTKPKGQGVAATPASKRAAKKPKAHMKLKKRDYLIPNDCVLDIAGPRVADIAEELRGLSLENHTNSVSVMFRVFLELSVDQYIESENLSVTDRTPLDKKIRKTLTDLLKKQKLTAKQATPVRRMIQKDSFLATTVDTMHAYVHNPHMSPLPTDLRNGWTGLQPFITAISRQ